MLYAISAVSDSFSCLPYCSPLHSGCLRQTEACRPLLRNLKRHLPSIAPILMPLPITFRVAYHHGRLVPLL
jgi:hypothetical protein